MDAPDADTAVAEAGKGSSGSAGRKRKAGGAGDGATVETAAEAGKGSVAGCQAASTEAAAVKQEEGQPPVRAGSAAVSCALSWPAVQHGLEGCVSSAMLSCTLFSLCGRGAILCMHHSTPASLQGHSSPVLWKSLKTGSPVCSTSSPVQRQRLGASARPTRLQTLPRRHLTGAVGAAPVHHLPQQQLRAVAAGERSPQLRGVAAAALLLALRLPSWRCRQALPHAQGVPATESPKVYKLSCAAY